MAKGVKTGGGSRRGIPNRTTQDVRTAIAQLAERNIGQLEKWMDRIALKDPARAADLLLRAIEYHVPKLARTEVTGTGGAPLTVNIMRFSGNNTPE